MWTSSVTGAQNLSVLLPQMTHPPHPPANSHDPPGIVPPGAFIRRGYISDIEYTLNDSQIQEIALVCRIRRSRHFHNLSIWFSF